MHFAHASDRVWAEVVVYVGGWVGHHKISKEGIADNSVGKKPVRALFLRVLRKTLAQSRSRVLKRQASIYRGTAGLHVSGFQIRGINQRWHPPPITVCKSGGATTHSMVSDWRTDISAGRVPANPASGTFL
jgi:hypothetical protein